MCVTICGRLRECFFRHALAQGILPVRQWSTGYGGPTALTSHSSFIPLVHFDINDISIPWIECSNIFRKGICIDTLRAVNNAVLSLIDRNLYCPVKNNVQTLFVNRFSVFLISCGTGINNILIQCFIIDVVVIALYTCAVVN